MSKFLILRFSSIGDIVLTSPVIRCLKQQVNDAEVHFATKKIFSSVIEHNPYLDKKILLEDDLNELIHLFRQEKYDYIIDLHHNLRTLIIRKKLGIKSYTFNKINFEKWMMVNLRVNRLPTVHVVDRYLDTLKSFGVENDGQGLDYFISNEDEKAMQQIPVKHQVGFVGFVIGAKHFTKQLPEEKIISICKKLNQRIILLGGKEDYEKGEAIVKACDGNLVYNACGKFSINQSAAIIKHASKIITHDTGLMHIAAAFKKEIISVWGNTIPEFGMAPYYGRTEIRNWKLGVRNLSCRPCSKIGFDRCPKGHFKCMNEINEEEIIRHSVVSNTTL